MAHAPGNLPAFQEGFGLNRFPLVEFDRKPVDPNLLRGFVIAWSQHLTLVHTLESYTFRLNGYAIIRNSDVKKWRPVPNSDFLARAVLLHKLRPSSPDKVKIDSMKQAVDSAGAAFPLITIHRERVMKNACFVGKALRTTQRSLTIRSISTQAEWEEEESYLLKDVTLLEFGGVYEKLLFEMAKKLA